MVLMTSSLVWHPRTQALIEHLSMNLPHGLVIDGPSGIGVRETASYLAKSIGSPAFIIEPKRSKEGKMVIDEQEGNIIIEDVRLLYEQTRTRQPGAQVYIFDTGERSMTIGAQNAFLKLLEEPRPGLYFIIATHRPSQLLPTIMSRSQRLQMLPVTDEQTREVIESLTIDDTVKKTRLAFVGQGLPALIHRLSADEKAYDKRVAIMSDAKNMLSGTKYDKLVTAHRYKDTRAEAIMLLDDMNHQLRAVIRNNPDQKLVAAIARYMDARQKILAGGNVRLQIAATVIQ